MLIPVRFRLTRRKMLAFIDEVDHVQETAVTLYLPQGASQDDISTHLERVTAEVKIRTEVASEITASQTGAVLFWGETWKRLIYPPFPLPEKYLAGGYDTSPLRTLLGRDFRIGIVLVRLGS